MKKEKLIQFILYELVRLFFIAFFCLTLNTNIYANTVRPLAIMIGNSPSEITHQTGLNMAEVIYEINVEYPFTRLMALFNNDDETIIGPVRSSRYYFSRLVEEWSVIFSHCGGQSLKSERIINLDQLLYPSPYWRDKNIKGWINLFTNTQNIRAKVRKMGFQEKVDLDNRLLDLRTLNLSAGDITKITIKYNSKYALSYEYKSDTNTYLRYINSEPCQDSRTLEPITISNIIVQHTSVEKISDDNEGRLTVGVIGEGIAQIFYGGYYHLTKWIKKSKDYPTVYYDEQGNVISLNQGNIWIHLVPEETEIWFK